MLYHIETKNGVISYDRNDCDTRSIKAYFLHAFNTAKPAPVKVKGWPFRCIYLAHGTEENGLYVAVRSKASLCAK